MLRETAFTAAFFSLIGAVAYALTSSWGLFACAAACFVLFAIAFGVAQWAK